MDMKYNAETGEITKDGKVRGWAKGRGYRRVMYMGKEVLAHRLAWFLKTGDWPKDKIDHINGIKGDNRWTNLRDVSQSVKEELNY